MKRVFSSISLIFTLPFKLLKKTRIDNFVGGLVFGAIFSLIVNLATVQVQESIQKQRILEAVENEILNNILVARSIADANKKAIDEKQKYNPFYSIQRYSRDLWTQSSEPLQYIAQLDQPTQIAVSGYYSFWLPAQNRMLDQLEKLTGNYLVGCNPIGEKLSENKQISCDQWNDILLDSERNTALGVVDEGLKVLEKFHPTKDRLNNWFLMLLMGDKSTRVLSGK